MELVSKALRHNFREFCSTIYLRLIDNIFQSCDIQPGNLPPGCKNFIAVYDPDGYINNSKGFERDLSDSTSELYIKVIVAPQY